MPPAVHPPSPVSASLAILPLGACDAIKENDERVKDEVNHIAQASCLFAQGLFGRGAPAGFGLVQVGFYFAQDFNVYFNGVLLHLAHFKDDGEHVRAVFDFSLANVNGCVHGQHPSEFHWPPSAVAQLNFSMQLQYGGQAFPARWVIEFPMKVGRSVMSVTLEFVQGSVNFETEGYDPEQIPGITSIPAEVPHTGHPIDSTIIICAM